MWWWLRTGAVGLGEVAAIEFSHTNENPNLPKGMKVVGGRGGVSAGGRKGGGGLRE